MRCPTPSKHRAEEVDAQSLWGTILLDILGAGRQQKPLLLPLVIACPSRDETKPEIDSPRLVGRSAEEADAQSLRCAILLDELDVPGRGSPDPRMGRILVELKTPNAVRLLNYCCSKRVQALPTALANARR